MMGLGSVMTKDLVLEQQLPHLSTLTRDGNLREPLDPTAC